MARTFRKSSVRIGRNPLNDLHIELPFVSQFHAVIDHDGRELILRDLGSTNGTLVAESKVHGESVSLGSGTSASFTILQLLFQIRVLPLDQIPDPRSEKKPLAVTGFLEAPSPQLFEAAARGDGPTSQEREELRKLHGDYREAWSRLMARIQRAALERGATERRGFVDLLGADLPGLGSELDFQRLAATSGSSISPRDGREEERIAFEGLRELASEYLQGRRPPESAAEFVAFLTRLRESLDAFFKAFISLREGHRQLRQDLGIPQGLSTRAEAVEQASTVGELSAVLLDAQLSSDAIGHVESTFADMMIHQVAMLNGVVTGAKSILNDLSPAEIKGAIDQGSAREYFGMSLGGPGPKQYWQEFEKRHSDIAEDEKQLFKQLFGTKFSVAYSQAALESGSSEEASGARRDTSRLNVANDPPSRKGR